MVSSTYQFLLFYPVDPGRWAMPLGGMPLFIYIWPATCMWLGFGSMVCCVFCLWLCIRNACCFWLMLTLELLVIFAGFAGPGICIGPGWPGTFGGWALWRWFPPPYLRAIWFYCALCWPWRSLRATFGSRLPPGFIFPSICIWWIY